MQNNPPAHLAGKSAAYDYLKTAPDSAWAWEFARRNPQLRRSMTDVPFRRDPARSDGVLIVRIPSSDVNAPIRWASSVDEDSAQATVAWNDKVASNALHVVSLPLRLAFGGTVLDLESIILEKTLLITEEGGQTLVLRDGQRSLQIEIAGSPITDSVALFVDTTIPKKHAPRQLRLLECFRMLRTTGELPASGFPRHPRSARNAFVIEALNGYLAGKHHRDIAVGLYGEARVERDWGDPSENMRDTVRRAVARGLSIMEKGYLDFLR